MKELLSELTKQTRTERGLSQEQMAELLRITVRAYGDLERGTYCFSSKALLFLFLLLTEPEKESKNESESRIDGFLRLFSDRVKTIEE